MLANRDHSDEELRRKIYIAIASLLGSVVLFFFFFIEEPESKIRWPLLAGVPLLMVTFTFARRGVAEMWLSRISMLYVVLLFLYMVSLSRMTSEIFYLLIIPMFAVFVFGALEGIFWAGLMLVASLLVGYGALPGFSPAETIRNDVIDFTSAYLLILIFTLCFEALRVRSRRRADRSVARLQRQFSIVTEANREREDIENRLLDYMRLASDWLFELDRDYRFIFLSSRFEQLSGVPVKDFIGLCVLDLLELYDDCDPEEQRRCLLNHEPFRDFRYSFVNVLGERVYVMTRGEPQFDNEGNFTGYLGSGTDITAIEDGERELRMRDRALQRVQRLDAIGQLTSGIAHDFNNLLMVIIGNMEMLVAGYDDKNKEVRNSVLAAANQASELTAQLLSFSRDQSLNIQAINVPKMMAEVGSMLERSLGEGIDLALSMEADLPDIQSDRSQLENALINLALNGRDAMNGKGRLTLSASVSRRSPNSVDFAVADKGEGIPEDMLERVMDPFFTTKPQGEGTGLGLSMVYGFVKQCGGEIHIDSQPGEGTLVTLTLPCKQAEPTKEGTIVSASHVAEEFPRRKVLLVEDQTKVRDILARMLEQLNQDVETRASGEEALELINGTDVDLVISDIMLGAGMSGVDLAQHIDATYPNIEVVLMSGFPNRNMEEFPFEFLKKPFGFPELRELLGRV